MKYLVFLLAIIFVFSGCTGFRSIDVAKEMQPMYDKDRAMKLAALQQISKMQRGGMEIEMKDGKVTKITYHEHLDRSVMEKALSTPQYHVKSGLEETAILFNSLTGIVVPLGSMYWGYKVTKSNNDVAKSMYEDFSNVQAKDPIIVEVPAD